MPIGTSSGEYFEDQYEYTARQPVVMASMAIPKDLQRVYITGEEGTGLGTRDNNVVSPLEIMPGGVENNVVHPDVMGANRDLDKWEVDPSTGTGLEIGFKRPLGGSTEPTGAFKSSGGSQVPGFVEKVKSVLKTIDEGLIASGILSRETVESTPQVLEGFYEGIKNAFKLPGDVYAGKIDPMSPQGIERAFDLAGLAVLGPMPVAKKMADGTLGSFAGVRSKTMDKNKLAEAQVMAADGAHPDDIWTKTGMFKGADGRWRQEINDSKAVAKPVDDLKGKSLEDVLDHPELFKAYPDLRNIEIIPFKGDTYGRAAYNSSNDTIELGKKFTVDDVLHEVQHAIQKREGFAKGGSPAEKFALRFEEDLRIAKIEAEGLLRYRQSDQFKGWTKEETDRIKELQRLFELESLRKGLSAKEAEKHYMRLAGEVEARNVETRAVLNPIASREIPPIWTEDTPRSQQYVSDTPLWTTPYGPTKYPNVAPSYAP